MTDDLSKKNIRYRAQELFQANFKEAEKLAEAIIFEEKNKLTTLKEFDEQLPDKSEEKIINRLAMTIFQEKIERVEMNMDILNFEYVLFGTLLDEVSYIKHIIQESNNKNKNQKYLLDEWKDKYEPILQSLKKHLEGRLEQAKENKVNVGGMYV